MRTSCDLRRKLCDEITSLFIRPSNTSPAFVCLSVRTGFDLFFRTMRFARGSEVIVSAVNIPGMIDIIREHGLVPVPWDIDVDTLSPKLNLLDTLITSRSVAVVVSHLFGKRCSNVDAAIRKARTHGLYFVEDCAEIFHGFEYLGHPDSDLAMFSFGAMKHFTTFGGAVCKVRDRGLHDAMTELHSLDPEQSRLDYLKKVCTTFLVAVGVNVPVVMRVGVPTSNLFGIDYKERAVQLLRGFPPGEDLWNRLRQQPSIPALILMRDRLRTATSADLRKTKEKGDFVRRLLPDGVSLPGRLVSGHDWLFPIVVVSAAVFCGSDFDLLPFLERRRGCGKTIERHWSGRCHQGYSGEI